MQLLSEANTSSPLVAARDILEAVPRVVDLFRHITQANTKQTLTIPQLRTLRFVRDHEQVILKNLADFVGTAMSSASRTVDTLVSKGLIDRKVCDKDRRQMRLSLTQEGAKALDAVLDHTSEQIAARLSPLSAEELAVVSRAMHLIREHCAIDVPSPCCELSKPPKTNSI